jgi:hypothetical protein
VAAAFVKDRIKHDLQRVVSAYSDGASLRQLAEPYGCSHLTMRSALVDAGLTMRRRQKRRREDTERGARAMLEHFHWKPRQRRG